MLQQLGKLISIVQQHIRSYLDEIFSVIRDFWTTNTPMHITLINLVEQIAIALGAEFKVFVPFLIPHIDRVFAHDSEPNKAVTTKLLQALQKFGTNLDDYLHLIIPPIMKLCDAQDVPEVVRKTAFETIDILSHHLQITDYASR